jgi:hypothetical protein
MYDENPFHTTFEAPEIKRILPSSVELILSLHRFQDIQRRTTFVNRATSNSGSRTGCQIMDEPGGKGLVGGKAIFIDCGCVWIAMGTKWGICA